MWSVNDLSDCKLSICKVYSPTPSSKLPLTISHSLIIHSDMKWTLHVHGKQVLRSTCSALSFFGESLDMRAINELIQTLNTCSVCSGNPGSQFVKLCKESKDQIMRSQDGSNRAYHDKSCKVKQRGEEFEETVRTTMCEIVVRGEQCDSCYKYRATLRAICSRKNKQHDDIVENRTSPSSHANYRFI